MQLLVKCWSWKSSIFFNMLWLLALLITALHVSIFIYKQNHLDLFLLLLLFISVQCTVESALGWTTPSRTLLSSKINLDVSKNCVTVSCFCSVCVRLLTSSSVLTAVHESLNSTCCSTDRKKQRERKQLLLFYLLIWEVKETFDRLGS